MKINSKMNDLKQEIIGLIYVRTVKFVMDYYLDCLCIVVRDSAQEGHGPTI